MKNAIDIAPVMIWITHPNSNCTYLNKKWYHYTGQAAIDGLGFRWLDAFHPYDKNIFEGVFSKANKTLEPFSTEVRLRDKNGEYKWHINSGLPNFDKNGIFLGFVGSIIDIHERKHAEDALRESEHLYKTFVEVMPQMAFIADVEGNIIYFNQQWYNYVGGIEDTERWGWKDKPIHNPEDLQPAIERWSQSLRTGDPYETEYRLRRHDGRYRWHLGRATPIRNSTGTIELWLGTNTDIHTRKETEKSLQENESKLRKANDNLKQKNRKLVKSNIRNENMLFIVAHDLTGP